MRARDLSLFLLRYVGQRSQSACVSVCLLSVYRKFYVFLCFSLFPFLELRFFTSLLSWSICLVFQLKTSIFFCFVVSSFFCCFFSVPCLIRLFIFYFNVFSRVYLCLHLYSLKLELYYKNIYPTKRKNFNFKFNIIR